MTHEYLKYYNKDIDIIKNTILTSMKMFGSW